MQARRWCATNGVALNPPKLDHYATEHLPERGDQVSKVAMPELDVTAAHVKLFIMILAYELCFASICGDEELRVLSVCFYKLASRIGLLNGCGMFLTTELADLAMMHGNEFLASYRYLAMFSAKHVRYRYKLRPKFHCPPHHLGPQGVAPQPFRQYLLHGRGLHGKSEVDIESLPQAARTFQRYAVLIGLRWQRIAGQAQKEFVTSCFCILRFGV
jgi:hypothetical protein